MSEELVTVPRVQWEGLLKDVADLKGAMGEVAEVLGLGDKPQDADIGAGFQKFMARGRDKRGSA